MDIRYIDSSKAREKFFDILAAVYAKKEEVVVKKDGIPVVKISCLEPVAPKKSFKDFFGIISDKEAKRMKKIVREGRRDGSRFKKYLVKR